MKAHSNNTILRSRILWFDGDSTIPEHDLIKMVSSGLPTESVFVDKLTDEIRDFNKLVTPDQQITIKDNIRELEFDWVIPVEYKELNPWEYIQDRLYEELVNGNYIQDDKLTPNGVKRVQRVSQEIKLYQQLNLDDVIRAIIFVINILINQDLVWGVGRGSSVASYILFLIGVHDIDSCEYNIKIEEFFHE